VRTRSAPPVPEPAATAISSDVRAAAPDHEPFEGQSVDEAERRAIEAAVARTNGNLSEATRQLGIGRTTLYRKLRKYGIAAR
jgi:transcriptional regulator of acetoin/glycerol metabolism